MKIGDIQTDIDGTEWVIIEVFQRRDPSRVRRNSLAHRTHAEGSALIAASLEEEKLAEPKTEVDRRFDRIEMAIGTMATWLVQAQTGFNAKDAEGIEKILRGEKTEELKENAST